MSHLRTFQRIKFVIAFIFQQNSIYEKSFDIFLTIILWDERVRLLKAVFSLIFFFLKLSQIIMFGNILMRDDLVSICLFR